MLCDCYLKFVYAVAENNVCLDRSFCATCIYFRCEIVQIDYNSVCKSIMHKLIQGVKLYDIT